MHAGQIVPLRAPRPPPVNARVAGTHEIALDEFRRRLGQSSFETWLGFIWRRDPDGSTRVRNATIAEVRKLTLHQVNRACRRLALAGLLESIGGSWNGRPICIRRVLGDYRNGLVTLPADALRRTVLLPKKGGARVVRRAEQSAQGVEQSAQGGGAKRAGSPTKARRVSETYAEVITENVESRRPTYEEGRDEKRGPEIRGDTEESDGSSSGEEDHRSEGRPLPRGLFEKGEGFRGLGSPEASRVPRFRPPANGIVDLIPPYPDNERMGAARLRNPPLLPADLPRVEQAWRLVYAYRGAVERVYKKARLVFGSVETLRTSSHFPVLVEAAAVLVEHQIAPIPWACWSVELWSGVDGKQAKRPPPVAWVWNPNRIAERRGWFGREAAAFDGGRVFQGQVQQDYRAAYKTLVARLSALPATASEEEIRPIVRALFPDGWEEWIEDARAENARAQAAIDREVDRGRWYW